METVIIASRNRNKLKEIEEITNRFGFRAVSRDQAGIPPFDIEEDGATFEENSFKKAHEILRVSGKITVADDSGLMVDCLGGAPGVYSARFAGEYGNDEKNNEKLLSLLENVPYEERGAKFVCVITMLFPDGRKITARGECPGRIAYEPAGNNGFGYDPLFVPEGFSKTFAQLAPEEKNRISHRGRALSELGRLLSERDLWFG